MRVGGVKASDIGHPLGKVLIALSPWVEPTSPSPWTRLLFQHHIVP